MVRWSHPAKLHIRSIVVVGLLGVGVTTFLLWLGITVLSPSHLLGITAITVGPLGMIIMFAKVGPLGRLLVLIMFLLSIAAIFSAAISAAAIG